MCNLSELMNVSGGYPSLNLYLSKEYDKSDHCIVFYRLRNNLSQRFAVNFKNSAERYLWLTYSTKEIINDISDRGELERDLKAINDAVSKSEGSRFWDWNEGSSPIY